MARGDAARVVHERVVEERGGLLVRVPTLPAILGEQEQVLREEPLLEREVLELVLRGRELGLRLERLRERNAAILLVEVQPESEALGVHLVDEQRVRHVYRRKLTPAGLLVGHGHVAEHRDPETARAVAKEHLEVRIDEHHHSVNELLGHRKLDAVELGALDLGLVRLAQVVRAVLEDLVHLLRVEIEQALVFILIRVLLLFLCGVLCGLLLAQA